MWRIGESHVIHLKTAGNCDSVQEIPRAVWTRLVRTKIDRKIAVVLFSATKLIRRDDAPVGRSLKLWCGETYILLLPLVPANRFAQKFGGAGKFELLLDAGAKGLNGFHADVQRLRNLTCFITLAKQLENL